MALVIYCKSCKKKIKGETPCPCGSTERKFYADYWPDGRNGKRKLAPIDTDNRDVAAIIEKEIRAAALEGRKPGAVKKSFTTATIEDLTPDYLEWVKLHRTKGTYREREYSMGYINKIIGTVPVPAFNNHHISLYQTTRKAQGVGHRTINKECFYIMGFLRWARTERGLNVRDVSMEGKKLQHHRPIPIVLSVSEIQRLLAVCTPFYKALFLCLYAIGLRWSEASGLQWQDIDFENRLLRCVQKGGSWKVLPMPDALQSILSHLKESSESSFVFYSKHGKKQIVNIRKAIKSVCDKAGITKRVYPHLLRHSFSTHLMSSGVNVEP